MKGCIRGLVAFVAMAAFLFAQMVMSAYACAGPVADPVAMAQMKAQMEGDGGLCEKHCATGTVSFELAKPAVSTMPAIVAAPMRVAPVVFEPVRIPMRAGALSIAGPAPPLIRFTVLRI